MNINEGHDKQLLRILRSEYEVARLRRALLGAVPLSSLAASTLCLTSKPRTAATWGALALGATVGLLWYGRAAQRAVLPAIVAGLVPLGIAMCGSHIHSFGSVGCVSWCVPACAFGGVIGGLALGGVALQRREKACFWVAGTGLTIMVGAMGCSCLGLGCVVGLLIGVSSGLVPPLAIRLLGKPDTPADTSSSPR